jgi:hypothetical protein
MYDTYTEAQSVVSALEAGGVPHSDISLIANADATGRSTATDATTTETHTGTGTGTGATLGTLIGGGAGLLAGIGSLAIPGVGPVVAAGWLVATLTGAGIGAAGGGLLGALTGAGVTNDEAHVYAEGVKRGGSLVTVRADEADAPRIEGILGQHTTADWQQRRTSYGSDWSEFKPSTDPVTTTTTTTTANQTGTVNVAGNDPTLRG